MCDSSLRQQIEPLDRWTEAEGHEEPGPVEELDYTEARPRVGAVLVWEEQTK